MAGELIVEAQYVFANNAVINTPVDVAVPADQNVNIDETGIEQYEVTVRNPSANTAVTVHVKSLEKQDAVFGGGSDRFPELTSFGVPINSPDGKSVVVPGWDLTRGGRVTITNDTALGAAAGFTGDLRVRRL